MSQDFKYIQMVKVVAVEKWFALKSVKESLIQSNFT